MSVWRVHENMSPCTGSRVNTNNDRIAPCDGVWFGIQTHRCQGHIFATDSDGLRVNHSTGCKQFAHNWHLPSCQCTETCSHVDQIQNSRYKYVIYPFVAPRLDGLWRDVLCAECYSTYTYIFRLAIYICIIIYFIQKYQDMFWCTASQPYIPDQNGRHLTHDVKLSAQCVISTKGGKVYGRIQATCHQYVSPAVTTKMISYQCILFRT